MLPSDAAAWKKKWPEWILHTPELGLSLAGLRLAGSKSEFKSNRIEEPSPIAWGPGWPVRGCVLNRGRRPGGFEGPLLFVERPACATPAQHQVGGL